LWGSLPLKGVSAEAKIVGISLLNKFYGIALKDSVANWSVPATLRLHSSVPILYYLSKEMGCFFLGKMLIQVSHQMDLRNHFDSSRWMVKEA